MLESHNVVQRAYEIADEALRFRAASSLDDGEVDF